MCGSVPCIAISRVQSRSMASLTHFKNVVRNRTGVGQGLPARGAPRRFAERNWHDLLGVHYDGAGSSPCKGGEGAL